MKQIFVLVPNLARAQLIRQLLELGGVHAHLSDGALPALTELERSAVDAVICAEDTGDMPGEDFRNILRYDPNTRLTPVFLLTDTPEERPVVPPNFNIPKGVGTLELVKLVLNEVGVSPLPSFLSQEEEGDLRGGVADVGLSELLTWVAEQEMDGHWQIDTGGKAGYLLMRRGDITYAEFGEYLGRDAVLEILDQLVLNPESKFRFSQASLPTGPQPRNIEERTERLLMEVTVDLDHRIAERNGTPH